MVQFGMEMTFGDWLKVRRRQLDLTQKALAYEAGCGLGTLRKLENGSRRPSKELAARIGQALQVPEEEMPVFVEFARSDPDPIQLPSFAQKQITPPQVQIPEPEPPNVSPPPHNLPFTLTRIIGRDGEIAELSHFLLHSHQRLITLVGVGGIGKTRLATAVAHAILLRPGQPFHDGIFFIPLAAIVYKEDIVTAVAQALDFQFTSGSRTPKQQLLDYLRDKRMLLFMDNFEQIQEGFSILLDILHIAGNVKVLVTSRETLGILGEQQYPLKGLSYPQRANALAELNEYAAPTLFLERAANLLPDFNITATEIADLLKICHLVDGMPLALELAVVWCDTLPLAEIAASIERNLGFLKSNWRDLPSRHQSIRAVFEASWLRMPSAEQIGFACLSVFRGGFTREAAESVAGLGPYQLKSLLTRAFIYLDRDHQRYQIHELLRQYAADILAKEVEDEFQAQNKHADFFTDFLWQRHEQWHSDKQKEILSGLLVERENIVQTWRWHCHNANIKAIASTLDSFANFLEWQGNIVEGEQLLQLALKNLNNLPETGPNLHLQGRLLTWQSRFIMDDDQSNQAFSQAQHFLEQAASHGEDVRLAQARLSMEQTERGRDRGRGTEMIQLYQLNVALYESLAEHWGTATALRKIGATLIFGLGQYEEAQSWLDKSLALFQEMGSKRDMAEVISFQGFANRFLGQQEMAEQAHQLSLSLWRQLEHRPGIVYGLACLANTLIFGGRFEEAQETAEEQLSIAKDISYLEFVLFAHITLCCANLHLGCLDIAHQHQLEAKKLNQSGSGAQFSGTHAGLVNGLLALANKQFNEAIILLADESLAEDIRYRAIAYRSYAQRAISEHRLFRFDLLTVLENGLIRRQYFPILVLLPAVSLALIDKDLFQRAIEIHTFASRYPHIANSNLFFNLAGREIQEMAADKPLEIVTGAQQQGKTLAFWQTAESLLQELSSSSP